MKTPKTTLANEYVCVRKRMEIIEIKTIESAIAVFGLYFYFFSFSFGSHFSQFIPFG